MQNEYNLNPDPFYDACVHSCVARLLWKKLGKPTPHVVKLTINNMPSCDGLKAVHADVSSNGRIYCLHALKSTGIKLVASRI